MATNSQPTPQPLPLRRRAQLKRVLLGEPVGQASLAVGYKTTASGYSALSDTRKRLLESMDHYSLTPETYVRDYLLPLLNATQTQYFSCNGVVTDERTDANDSIRLAAVKEVGKLLALYPREEAGGATHLNILINNASTVDTE